MHTNSGRTCGERVYLVEDTVLKQGTQAVWPDNNGENLPIQRQILWHHLAGNHQRHILENLTF